MLLAIDIGNTNVVFALCDAESTLHQWRIRTEVHRTADEYAVWLFALMHELGISREVVAQVAIASVVPEANFALKSFAREYLKCEPLLFLSGDMVCDMPVLIDNPHELGADRLINAYAAWQTHKTALIVIDFGTATTFDVVSVRGEYIGGVIAPGINLSLEALQKAAAKLHGVAINRPAKAIGTNTTAAMQSGIYFGYAGLIEGILARITAELGTAPRVIATGGLATLYATATTHIHDVDEDLTIRGIRLMVQAAKA